MCILVCMYVFWCTLVCMHVWRACMGTYWVYYVCVCVFIPLPFCVFDCVLKRCGLVREIRISCRRPEPDSDSYSLWIRYTDDSKTDPWDDLEIRTGSYSEDQTTIHFQNRVISCECLFLCYFLIYHVTGYLCFTFIISYVVICHF